MRRFSLIAAPLLALLVSCGGGYRYESVPGDPMNTRIYTLDNGLKVYLAVDTSTPRIQANIAVRAGGKNSPLETTGLAHYFEHLMFKGTQQFGTTDYAAEEPLLDRIEELFEVYRRTTDEAERKELYRQIDSISYQASKIAIPNEYDKLMSAIGASGTNAYTSEDETVYTENIPSNQVENWAMIQADRFRNVVLRGFHTELETIYEEYNMYSVYDSEKVYQAIMSNLMHNHPYGLQTVIGEPEHLKNPSMTNIKRFHDQYYVPNNMAICMAGDFDPDEVIRIIDRYFGDMEPNPDLAPVSYEPETPLASPVEAEVVGLEAECLYMSWLLDGAASEDAALAEIVTGILSNGKSGLIDIDINQQQKALAVSAGYEPLTDYSLYLAMGMPKSGQTLDEIRALILEEISRLRAGDFDESLITATVNNLKADRQRALDSNSGKVQALVDSFIGGILWEDEVSHLDRMAEITKEDVVRFANEKLADNYVVVYKRQGTDPDMPHIEAPQITPIESNRDAQSDFLTKVQNTQVRPIEPVFVDFSRDMDRFDSNGLEVLYKRNETNDLFELSYVYETGTSGDPLIDLASTYIEYLGTSDMSADELNSRLYALACDISFVPSSYRTTVTISGLSENMAEAMTLYESWISDIQPDDAVLENLKADMLKVRMDALTDQDANFQGLTSYLLYGPEQYRAMTLTNDMILSATSEELLSRVAAFRDYEHRIVYYGPMDRDELTGSLAVHPAAVSFAQVPANVFPKQALTQQSKVLVADYDANQLEFLQYSNRGESFDTANDADIAMYNEYFGGGMNSIVFQEMREARGLAYSANASISSPSRLSQNYLFSAGIATQNDKMAIAIDAFDEIINQMPESEAAFAIAKEAVLSRIRTSRVVKSNVLWRYIQQKDLGIDYDRNKDLFTAVSGMTLEDVVDAQRRWAKDRTYHYCVLGRISDLDMDKLSELGEVTILSKEDIFPY